MIKLRTALSTVALAGSIAAVSTPAMARDTISIVGSSTVYPFATVVAERFGSSTDFPTPKLESTGSGGGLKLFCAGIGTQHPDITNASRRMKTSEYDLCQKNGVKDITEFRIGILGGENAQDRLTSNECVRAYVEDLLGVETKIFTPADYDGVIQGLLGGTIDMAWLGASAYAKTYLTDPEAVDVVLVKTNLDGSYAYHSIGIARVDSGITSLADMEGKTFGFGDPCALATRWRLQSRCPHSL